MLPYVPKISIITVVYNGEPYLEKTMFSVFEQTYSNIEYLIIDGKSKDGTLSIIRRHEARLAAWISEADKGLYDAMNKGLQRATGDFVLFLNAGDCFAAPDVLTQVFSKCDAETDVLYGEVMMVTAQYQPIGTRSEITTRQLPSRLTWRSMRFGMVVCHQAFIPRREICPKYIENNLSADIDWVIKILKKSRKTVYTEQIIAHFLVGGVSKQRHWQSLKDRFAVLQTHFGTAANLFNHALIFARAVWFNFIKIGKPKYS
jgi:glycosyltransferase involved in cell wall biosynthesis